MRYTILLAATAICLWSTAAHAQGDTIVPAAGLSGGLPGAAAGGNDTMTPEQRSQYVNQYLQKWQTMTPQQKQAAEAEAQSGFNKLTPAEQQKLKGEAVQEWGKLSPQSQESLVDQAKSSFDKMTPAQQQQMKSQALQQWQNMTPAEKEQLKSQFSSILKGDLAGPTN